MSRVGKSSRADKVAGLTLVPPRIEQAERKAASTQFAKGETCWLMMDEDDEGVDTDRCTILLGYGAHKVANCAELQTGYVVTMDGEVDGRKFFVRAGRLRQDPDGAVRHLQLVHTAAWRSA